MDEVDEWKRGVRVGELGAVGKVEVEVKGSRVCVSSKAGGG